MKAREVVPEGRLPSNRRLVQRFAAHLAHLLNDGADTVAVQAFALFTRLTATLERREQGAEAGPYDGLTELKLLGPGTTPQEAALVYVDQVIRRPLQLARDEPLHRGHVLFLMLCRRGLDAAWAAADLKRMQTAAPGEANRAPADFAGVAERLARLSPDIGEGNPAKSTRAAAGPLYLCVAGAAAEVAEEMSLWDAMTSGPPALRVLARGADFNGFCSAMIKAVEAANARYGTLIALGLSPRDWQDLSVNTAKKVSVFLGEARPAPDVAATVPAAGIAVEPRGAPDDRLDRWQQAWEIRQVPGFASAREFWDSPLGHALRNAQTPVLVELESEAIEDPAGSEATMLDSLSFERMIERGLQAGALSAFDGWFLRKLSQGETITALGGARETQNALGKAIVSKKMIESYASALQERIHAFVRSLPAG